MSQQFFANHSFARDNAALDLTELARKACWIHQDGAGLYSWLSLGLMAERRLEAIIRQEMDAIGFCETRLSLMQDADLWRQSGRLDIYGQELMTLKGRSGRLFCLGATCEELATSIVKTHYDKTHMGIGLYQIGNKYRDELRVRGGLARAREFSMKDAYSFHSDAGAAKEAYASVRQAYLRIFKRLGLDAEIRASDNGEIGGASSEEFLVASALGTEEAGGERMLECGHIFDLGDKYSRSMELRGADGSFVHMGCFGIGVSRLAMLMLERQRDERGFWGSREFHSFDTVISVVDWSREEHRQSALEIYAKLRELGMSVLLDDRDMQAGKKLADAELIGCRQRVIVSKKSQATGSFELMDRQTMERGDVQACDIVAACMRDVAGKN